MTSHMIRDSSSPSLFVDAIAAAGLPQPTELIVLESPAQRDHGDLGDPGRPSAGQAGGGKPARRRGGDRGPAQRGRRAAPGSRRDRRARIRQPLPAPHVAARRAPRRSRGGGAYGTSDALAGRRINLEFVSANPTGPLHAGGGRWVAVGDAIANLLAAQGAQVSPRVLPERHRQSARDVPRLALAALPTASRRPTTATRASTWSRSPTRCAPSSATTSTPDDAASWGVQRIIDEDARRPRSNRRALRHLVLRADAARARRRRRRARRARRQGLASSFDKATAPGGCAPPTSATPATACSCKSDGTTTYLCNDLAYHRDKLGGGFEPPHRHLGRRPPRPGEVDAGRHAGARLRAHGRTRGAARPVVKLSRRRGRVSRDPHVEARRQRS